MKQQAFENAHRQYWANFEALCVQMKKSPAWRSIDSHQQLAMPDMYRQICHHYALAKHRHYSLHLVEKLHALVMQGHAILYGKSNFSLWLIVDFMWRDFPSALRQHSRHFWIAAALFFVPAALMGVSVYYNDSQIYSLLSAGEVKNFEYMYDPEHSSFGRSINRATATDIRMLGHYIQNNIGIDFKAYASGLVAGIGPVFIAVYNGVYFGAVAGYLSTKGSGSVFWQFVAGHSALELIAMIISVAAGLRLGQPLIAPGRRSYGEAFKKSGKDSIKLLMGAAIMTFLAAFIEAFWSSKASIAPGVKYMVGLSLWFLVALYLLRAGKGQNESNQGS